MTIRASIHHQNLDKIFYPESVAIVGANKVSGTVPNDILMSILHANFNGVVFPVSPREKFIAGVKAYKYVIDIEDPVDLAILVFPSSVCHMALEQCGKKGIKAVIIISAGFKEVGGAGIDREKRLIEIANKYDMSFIGPNCLGVINTDPRTRLNASFARKMPEEGSIGFLSQSGALCTAVLDYAQAKHIGFSKFISFGNKADISEIDLLYYLAEDEKTKVILLYLEEVSKGKQLMLAARDIIQRTGKPILVLKSGRTSEGASAAASHTGSLAGRDDICDAAFEQSGIIRCYDIEEMFNRAIALTYQPAPRSNKVAIITNAGGPGVLTTDAAIMQGLSLASFNETTSQLLKKHLPATANTKNPIDVIGDARADRYNAALSAVFNDPDVAGVFVILTPQSMTEIEDIAKEITVVSEQFDKPIYTSFMGESDVAPGIDILQRNKIPHYILPESMADAFATVWQFEQIKQKEWFHETFVDNVLFDKAHMVFTNVNAKNQTYITEDLSSEILQAYRFPLPQMKMIQSQQEALNVAETIGYPMVMKVVSNDIIHKSDVHGVTTDIRSPEEVRLAFQTMKFLMEQEAPNAALKGMLLVQQVEQGIEAILGIKHDPSFGHVMMFGLGGIFVEIYKDVCFKVLPITEQEAWEMVSSIKAAPLLKGARGTNPKDLAAIVDCMLKLNQLVIDFPQIKELDINPLIIHNEGKGCHVADAKIFINLQSELQSKKSKEKQ
ncbi:CoA-binding protein [Puteibacter caeruleilacunae]|nr:CoA-binding protein [Puteibacter caeruleilacunae]